MPPATDRGLSSTGRQPPTSRTLPACFAATSPDGEAFLAGFARAKKGPLVKGGWPRQRSGGFRRAVRGRSFPGNLRTRKRAGLPPSLAPLAHNSFTPPCRGRACPARSLAITTPFILCIVGRGLDPSAGRRGRRPLQHNPQGFSLPQTSAAAWGQAALHPTLPHSVGRAFARNSFTPPCRGRACPARSLAITTPFILCIVGRQATGPLHNRPAPSNTKITCLRPLAGRLFF